MDRLLNYYFTILLIFVFTVWAPQGMHGDILAGFAASMIICFAAFALRWLTLDGAGAALVIGTVTYGMGGWVLIISLIFFFLSSAVFSLTDASAADESAVKSSESVRRSGLQVWSNGFWLTLWIFTGVITGSMIFYIMAAAAIAAATADTWATELGSRRFDAETYLITTFRKVPAGVDGGISWPGVAASVAGSIVIAVIVVLGFPVSLGWFFGIVLVGVAGSLFDSYLGARFQDSSFIIIGSRLWAEKKIAVNNNAVNWAATGFSSVMILILNFIFT